MTTDRSAIYVVVADCERYWKAAGLRRRVVADMRSQLEQHLVDAAREGRTPESVVGPDTAAFAAEWAAAEDASSLPTWEDVLMRRSSRPRWIDAVLLVAIVGTIVGLAIITRGEGADMDNEVWRWFWVISAVVLSVGEMFTAGFFMLPLGIGAGVAAALAFFDVPVEVQVVTFMLVSAASLWLLQRFAKKGDENQLPVGANRFVGMTATVLEAVDRAEAVGRVRMDTEVWRATTDGGPIAPGVEVRIVEVRGTRLVVEPID